MVWNALSLLLYALVSTAFLAFLGYGLAKLLLPREWRCDEGLLAPLLGYVLLLLVGYYGVRTVLNLRAGLFLVLGIALLLNGLALWRRRGERLSLNLREHGLVWLIAMSAFFLAVLPLMGYGYSTVIGENWDPENYIAVTEYLLQVPVDRIEAMPPNPLRELNVSPPGIGLTLGFCILEGILQQLRGWDALRSFAPTLALLRGLAVPALYLLFRRGLRMERRPALIATLFGGLYALGLWVALFNFGMQMAALPLVPLALTLFLAVLRQPSWSSALLAAVSVAALPVAYYPGLTVFVPIALGLGLYELVRAERRRVVLLAGLGTALLSLVLALGTVLDYGAGFSFRYSRQTTTLGLFHWLPWDQFLGFTPFSRQPEALFVAGKELQMVAVVLVLLLALTALWRSRRRWLWLAALLPGILYLGWLRGWFWPPAQALLQRELLDAALAERFRPYPYAYMKGVVFVAPLVLACALEGWNGWWEWVSDRLGTPRSYRWRAMLVGLLLLPIALTLWSNGRLVARYWERPSHFDRAALQVEEAVDLLPEGAGVYLSGRPERSRVQLGLFAYFLREHPVYGRLSMAYGAQDRRIPGEAPSYALLDAADDPLLLGFMPEGRIWAGGGMALYERDPAWGSFLDLRGDAYAGRPAAEIHAREPLAERLLQSYGRYSGLSEQALSFFADAERLSLHDDLEGVPGSRALVLALATFEPTTVQIIWDEQVVDELVLAPGFSLYRTESHPLPAQVRLVPQGEARVWPCWVALSDGAGETGVQPRPQEVLLLPETTVEGQVLDVDLLLYNDNGRPLRMALEVWEDTFQGAHHYAWWGPLVLPERGSVHLRADLGRREAQAWVGEQEVALAAGAEDWPEMADGSYFAALWLYYGHQIIEVLPVGHFRLVGGQVQGLTGLPLGLRPLWPHSPEQSSGAHFGPGIELSAYERAEEVLEAGDEFSLALEWRALELLPTDYFVTAQILGEGRLWGQWDGPVGQWYPATAWQPGQHVRDDVPLRIDPETPPGRYRLIVAVYDVATGERLPVYSSEGQELGDVLDLGEMVVR